MWGVNSRSIFELQLIDLNLGSTSSLAKVTSMSNLRSCGGLTPDLDPPLDPYLCSTFCGSTPSPALSMSDPRSCWGPLSIQIQLQIHICVVLWGSTPSLAPVTSMSHLQIMCVCRESTLYLDPAPDPYFYRWSFWMPTTLCYLQNWMFCPITPFQVVTIEKIIHKLGLYFPDNHFEDLQPYVIFKTECFVPELCSTLSDLKNSFTNRGPFLRWLFCIPKTLFYLQNWTFCPIIQLQMHSCVVPLQGQFLLWLQSHLFLTLYHVGGQLHLQLHIWVATFWP